MGKLFYIMGKSASGKDKIYRHLLEKSSLNLKELVLYTTRPIRVGEVDGKEYHFVDDTTLLQLQEEGKIIEQRAYNTVHGVWNYFTVDDGQMDLSKDSYLGIGTLESYDKLREYYGHEMIVPIYIEVEDGIRLERALKRERKQETPKYQELCRRFLADSQDFSEDQLGKVGITKRIENNEQLADCLKEVEEYIESML